MDINFFNDYQEGLDALYESAGTFGHIAQALGHPKANYNITTARVVWSNSRKRTTFEVNPDFFAEINAYERGAVIAHETYHVLLNHFKDMDDPYYRNENVLSIAHECIINDGLFENVGLQLPHLNDPEKAPVTGTGLFNYDFSYFTSRQGYDYIMENNNASSNDDHDDNDNEDSNGTGTNAATDQCGGVCIDDADIKKMQKYVQETLETVLKESDISDISSEIMDIMANNDVDLSAAASDNTDPAVMHAPEATMNVNWRKILAAVNPKVNDSGRKKINDTWMKPNRRHASIYPKVILPSYLPEEKDFKKKGDSLPTIIIALDLSQSIPRYLVSNLIALVDDTPKHLINAVPVTWSNDVVEYDSKTKKIVSPYGTKIDVLYNWCVAKGKQLNIPKPHVLVITDGGCNFRGHEDQDYIKEKWHWCAISPSDVSMIQDRFGAYIDNKIYQLKDFEK